MISIGRASGAPPASGAAGAPAVARAWSAARRFEAMAVGELLQPMFATVDTAHGPFGGGVGEENFRPLYVEAVAKQIAAHDGLGLAAPIAQALLAAQARGR